MIDEGSRADPPEHEAMGPAAQSADQFTECSAGGKSARLQQGPTNAALAIWSTILTGVRAL